MRTATNFLFGYPVSVIRKATGLPFATIYRHIEGKRSISPQVAILYHRGLGIPLSDIRPDIWTKAMEAGK